MNQTLDKKSIEEALEAEFSQLNIEKWVQKWKDTDTWDTRALSALNELDMDQPEWTYVAARCYLKGLYEQVQQSRKIDKEYTQFPALIQELIEQGIYDERLKAYSNDELQLLEEAMQPNEDERFTYIGIKTLADRYLARHFDGTLLELPQERWMVISMMLMVHEPVEKRVELVKESYWALSHLYMTVATPTLANAGKKGGQLSSCFIDTVEDDLRSIFDSCTDAATVSKNGGGLVFTLVRSVQKDQAFVDLKVYPQELSHG